MAVNKVEINGKTVLDLTGDSVTPEQLAQGTTAHNAAGEQITGTYTAEVFYINLAGNYPNYTCPVAMADIKAAYEAGKVLECRCKMGPYTATLPLFIPMPGANTWIFSGAGALTAMQFDAQSLTIAIVNGAVQASQTQLATKEVASPTQLGLVQPVAKTDAMTRSIGVDDSGGLYTEPAAWYVTITQTSADEAFATADKTPQEILAAYQAGYSIYAFIITKGTDGTTVLAPVVFADPNGGTIVFSVVRSFSFIGISSVAFYALLLEEQWTVGSIDLATKLDKLPNPNALTITSGSNSVTYDGSTEESIDIPVCNANLLDNWYFGNPVNQRGASGTISTAGYFFDRWKLVSGSVTINNGAIVLNGTIAQVREYAVGQAVTATVLTSDGVTDVTPVYDDEAKTFTVTAQGKIIRAVKLELGTQQTLAHFEGNLGLVLSEIPKFSDQLAECQRYYQVYTTEAARPAKALDCRPVMRANPEQSTINVWGTTLYANSAEL